MISTDLTINSGDLNHRNCVGYYFARWFDEPFAVAVLNLLDTNSRYALADDAQDQQHVDYTETTADGRVVRSDSKVVTRNFPYKDETTSKTNYADVVTVGEYVLTSSNHPDIISFYYRNRIYQVDYSGFVTKLKPVAVSESEGENNHKQRLFHYRIVDIHEMESSVRIKDVPHTLSKCYDAAMKILEQTRNFILEIPRATNDEKRAFYTKVRYDALERMRNDLTDIIYRFNKELQICQNSAVLPEVDVDYGLTEIYDLLR